MQLAPGAVSGAGLPTRRLRSHTASPTPFAHRRCCVAHASRDKRDGPGRGSGPGYGVAPPSQWVLPKVLVGEPRPASQGAEQRVGSPAEQAAPSGTPSSSSASISANPPLTVYTVRFTTGTSRGAALSDPYSAVNVCLIGANGRAALHRVSPVNDPVESRAHTAEMCQLIDSEVGADCSAFVPPPPPAASGSSSPAPSPASAPPPPPASSQSAPLVGRPPPPAPPKRRFQEGMVDEVSFLVPELGPLSGVLVGVEAGAWYLDEMDVSSSRTGHMDRFVCRRPLGGKVGEGAALLTPVPVGAVVYGEGEQAVVLTKDQAAALWSLNMNDYTDLKKRLAATTALLVASGASLAALTGGTAAALPYAAGGVVGLMYQWMLMRGVDHVMVAASGSSRQAAALRGEGSGSSSSSGSGTSGVRHGVYSSGNSAKQQQQQAEGEQEPYGGREETTSSGTVSRILGSAPLRLGFVCASAALGLALLGQEEAAAGAATTGPTAAWQLFLAALGFLTYKVALVGVSLGESAASTAAAAKGVAQRANSQGANRTEFEKYKRD
ncbi:hypothetical protein HYH02_013996 [Chlamydomonas schloesseri]|uniref:Uncharacterized protein n=1 Tax=Chlamydomonas schloesseri TaxID=2026947 RepID=A0A835VXM9_9CHLO|nr:hypothetical protein HYH02_013996 [Chlamydomonas schloesseri]|eukprot:KAG2429658.1 hypothetical protein HYH02_013996 [Chlamydomonas schloesseri]